MKLKAKEIGVVLFLLLVCFAYVYVQVSGDLCDTPFGAGDYRCIGYYRR
jgi:hypothetical protein